MCNVCITYEFIETMDALSVSNFMLNVIILTCTSLCRPCTCVPLSLPQELNTISLRLAGETEVLEKLDNIRVKASRRSPMMETIELVSQHWPVSLYIIMTLLRTYSTCVYC